MNQAKVKSPAPIENWRLCRVALELSLVVGTVDGADSEDILAGLLVAFRDRGAADALLGYLRRVGLVAIRTGVNQTSAETILRTEASTAERMWAFGVIATAVFARPVVMQERVNAAKRVGERIELPYEEMLDLMRLERVRFGSTPPPASVPPSESYRRPKSTMPPPAWEGARGQDSIPPPRRHTSSPPPADGPARSGGSSPPPADESRRSRASSVPPAPEAILADAYRILGVRVGAPMEDVRRAFRRLALVHHPDRHTGKEPTAYAETVRRFQVISRAYHFLVERTAERAA
jgi:hypothetical protein